VDGVFSEVRNLGARVDGLVNETNRLGARVDGVANKTRRLAAAVDKGRISEESMQLELERWERDGLAVMPCLIDGNQPVILALPKLAPWCATKPNDDVPLFFTVSSAAARRCGKSPRTARTRPAHTAPSC